MHKFKNIHLDDSSMWPKEPRVQLEETFEDNRGYIKPLVNFPMKNLSMIFSKKGSVRSNHNHYTDWHYMYTVYGKYEYHYRPHGAEEELKIEIYFSQFIHTFTNLNQEIMVTMFLKDYLHY